jgi:cobalt-zinc-cadmium efflux system outer membrane protein
MSSPTRRPHHLRRGSAVALTAPLLLVLLLTLLVATCVEADELTAGPIRLTVSQAVARALANNINLSANRRDIEVARANLERSKAWLPANPFVTGGAQHGTNVSPTYTFSLSQEFEIAGQRDKRIGAATQGVEAATWEMKAVEQNLAATVKTAFVHALISDERITLAQQHVDAAHALAEDLAGRKRPSDADRIDLNVAQIQEIRARQELAAAQQAAATAQDALRRLVGVPVDQRIALEGAPEREPQALPASRDLVDLALRQRPDLAALRHTRERADLQLALSNRELVPNVTVSGTFLRFESENYAGGDIGIPIPIFRRKTADVREATSERTHIGLETENLEREIEKQVLDAARTCRVAADDVQAQFHDIVPKSEENYRLETRLYERGVVTVSELIGLQIDLLTARRDYLDTLESYNDALIELERAIGGDLQKK